MGVIWSIISLETERYSIALLWAKNLGSAFT
jgi:hypothetical protein